MALNPAHLEKKIAGLLVGDPLQFPAEALPKVQAVVEVAARHPVAEEGADALFILVRLALALDTKGHKGAAKDIVNALITCPPAVERLDQLRQKDAQAHAAFQRFVGSQPIKRAPRHDGPAGPGIKLGDLLPPGGKLDPGLRIRKK